MAGDLGYLEDVVAYPEARWRELFLYRPNVLAAGIDSLAKLAEYVFHGAWDDPSVDTAIFALTAVGQSPISEDQRLHVWRAFRVPIYELLVDVDEGVLAAECEAHEGWHVRHPQLRFELRTGRVIFQKHGLSASPLLTGLTADGLDGVCACGGTAPLLRNVRRQAEETVLIRAARA